MDLLPQVNEIFSQLLQSHRWSPEDASNGSHWDVFNLQASLSSVKTLKTLAQGVDGIWYAGSSVIFESVPAVMEYNELLLRQMDG